MFDHITGMTELNGKDFSIHIINNKVFSIEDTSKFHPHDSSYEP